MLFYSTILLAFPSLGLCATWKSINDVPKLAWDFIIVGGGTAGSALAGRLTENPKFKILVIEAGPTNEGVLESIVPGLRPKLADTRYDWNFTTIPIRGLNNRSIAYQRGHILGGTSSVNGMVYSRGASSDYDRWASVTGDPGWGWDKLQPFIRKQEKFEQPADNHSVVDQVNLALHGRTGSVPVSIPGFLHPASDEVTLKASKQLGGEFSFNLDWNSGNPLGLGWLQTTIGHDGTRSSAATSYLTRQVRARKNLHIVTDTRVTRVLRTAGTKGSTIRTVEIRSPDSPSAVLLTASKEVVLSGGAIGTPQILLNSGIGDRDDLESLGIPVVLHNPSVGRNLSDHTALRISFGLKSGAIDQGPWANLLIDPVLQAQALELWKTNKTGPYVGLPVDQLSWIRVPNSSPVFKSFQDPSSGPSVAHNEMVIGAIADTYAVVLSLVSPASRGFVRLKTNSPFDDPMIDPNFYGSEVDILITREGVKAVMRFAQAPVLKELISSALEPWVNVTTDEEIDAMIKDISSTAWHPVGTASMSPKNANWGVVNPDLLVKRVSGLRVVDASIMPYIPCAHTQTPVYLIAERAADLIATCWK